MRWTLDRYVFKEILPPFFLALLIFTFLLVLPPVMEYLENLLAKGVTWGTAARILWTLLPQALGLTIPMAVLVGILIGLGRMSGDREAVDMGNSIGSRCRRRCRRQILPDSPRSSLGMSASAPSHSRVSNAGRAR